MRVLVTGSAGYVGSHVLVELLAAGHGVHVVDSLATGHAQRSRGCAASPGAAVAAGLRPALEIFGGDFPTPDGTGVRDYLQVVDLARAHLAALDWTGRARGARPFNLGTGAGVSGRAMAEAFAAALGAVRPAPDRSAPAVRLGDLLRRSRPGGARAGMAGAVGPRRDVRLGLGLDARQPPGLRAGPRRGRRAALTRGLAILRAFL